jgi:hypothetical protein
MENDDKIGKAISDKHIKAVKKLTKNMLITPSQNDGYYLDSDLNNSVIKIKSVRKYLHRHTQWLENKDKYVYEIDVIVDMRSKGEYYYYGTNHYCQRNAKRYNKYYRNAILGAVAQELKYFGIDNREMNVVISKIQYTEI